MYSMHWFNSGSVGYVGLAFLALIIIILFVGYKKGVFSNFSNLNENKNEALEIIKKRFASGEITEPEFLEIKKDLITNLEDDKNV